MPTQESIRKARADKKAGKSASTQAGNFVKEEIDRVREGKHGVRNAKQAIAIGLSEARKAGVDLPKNPNAKKKTSSTPKKKASSESKRTRAKASLKALKKEPTSTVSKSALSIQAKSSAKKRGPAQRKQAAKKAARTRKEETLH